LIIVFTSLPLIPLLSKINAVYDHLPHFFKIHINVLPPTQFSSLPNMLPRKYLNRQGIEVYWYFTAKT